MKSSIVRGCASCLVLALLSACSSDKTAAPAGGGGLPDPEERVGRIFTIKPNAAATTDMVVAMTQAAPGDVIQFDCGYFELGATLQLINTEDVKIKGCGRDKTVLSFKNNNAPEGILAVNVNGLVVQDLTVLDTGGNGIELRGVNHAVLQRVRTIWSSGGGRASADPITAANFTDPKRMSAVPCTDPATQNPNAVENSLGDTSSRDYTVSPLSGRYGIYPVSSENILIDQAESIGASDAGIYVGQTNNAIIKNSRAAFNVFGFEIENVGGGEYANNLAECNTGGFLIYDLDGLRQYGDRSRMYGNKSINNNTYNFTSGGFVGNVPPGSGMITLSYDRIDIFDNEFRDNNTGGIIHASYALFPPGDRPSENRIDWYSEGVHIFRNKFVNNGNGLPAPTTSDIENQDVARFLPALVGLKNVAACTQPGNAAQCAALNGNTYRGAHIIWDGLLDAYDAQCPYPLDKNGNPVPADARGKPQHTNEDPNPPCHYNAYKFDRSKPDNPRIVPDWFASCIDDDNEFSADSITYSNFHGTRGLEALVNSSPDPTDPPSLITVVEAFEPGALPDFPSSFDMSAHQCPAAYGKNLPPLPPVVIPPFVPTGDYDPAPTAALIAELCNAPVAAGAVNFAASRVNCPTLDQYHLFADPEDPTSAPNGDGLPFALTTKLFSDYSVKYRVAYLPPGTQAIYRDASEGVNFPITLPVGTIIAKTFAFADEEAGTEVPVETRLLIKRASRGGKVRWDGLPYLWETVDGKRVARLSLIGGKAAVSWKHTDVDSGVLHSGSTSEYLIPNINQCVSCHSTAEKEPGASPIGLKTRLLNTPYRPESHFPTAQGAHAVLGKNQLHYWCSTGRMIGCPDNLAVDPVTQIANVARVPIFNKPGDSGFPADSDQDIEARARAYLEVNCQHCHNVRGFAGSTGLFLDVFRAVDQSYGICKQPTATGQEGNGGRTYDIHPANVADSILPFRIGPTATTPAARMPPLARSVVHEEGHALIERWIRDVVTVDPTKYPNSENCGDSGGGLPLP